MAGALVAAAGLRLAWLDLAGAAAVSRWIAIGAFAVSLVLLIGAVKVNEHHVFTPESSMKLYAASFAAVIVIVLAALVLRAASGSGSGAIALGLVPLLLPPALTSPLIVYPTVKKIISGVPVTTPTPVLVPGILTALHWLRDHTPQNTVFAVNNHWIDEARTNAKYYYYAPSRSDPCSSRPTTPSATASRRGSQAPRPRLRHPSAFERRGLRRRGHRRTADDDPGLRSALPVRRSSAWHAEPGPAPARSRCLQQPGRDDHRGWVAQD